MDDVLAKAEEWRAAGEQVALATVVATRRSAPRPLGSKLAVTASGRLFGSVSGGCVEADVAERAQTLLATGGREVVTYGSKTSRPGASDFRAAARSTSTSSRSQEHAGWSASIGTRAYSSPAVVEPQGPRRRARGVRGRLQQLLRLPGVRRRATVDLPGETHRQRLTRGTQRRRLLRLDDGTIYAVNAKDGDCAARTTPTNSPRDPPWSSRTPMAPGR